jgi:TM2 domain-containing membrane protein YozV
MEQEMKKKNPGVAAILSFFWPGLGQIYNGQIAKGIGIMFALAILAIITVPLLSYTSHWMVALLHDPEKVPGTKWIWILLAIGLTAFLFVIWFSQVVSAYKKAVKINQSGGIRIRSNKEDSRRLRKRVEKNGRIRRDFKRWYER